MANETSTSPALKGSDDNQASGSSLAGHVADQVRVHAGDVFDKIKGVGAQASSTVDDLKDKTAGLIDDAKGAAASAGTKATDALESQKAAGTERVTNISEALRRAAGELEHDLPPAATYIKRAADEIDNMADALKRRDVRQILGDVQDLARQQPAAFIGATVLAGFALVRLLKTPTTSQGGGAGPAVYAPAASSRKTALVSAQPSYDDKPIMGGSGDPGGISPQAPGFDFKPTGSNLGAGSK